jgi:hypothetical protein
MLGRPGAAGTGWRLSVLLPVPVLVGSGGIITDADNRFADSYCRALWVEQLDDPSVRAGQFDGCLGCLNLGEDVAARHDIAWLDSPGEDLGFGQALPGVGHTEGPEIRHCGSPGSWAHGVTR